MNRLVVVGGGVLGTMHAVEAIARGWEVVHLEQDDSPRGASVRNFGLIWVSGRAPGRELDLALLARRRWEEVARDFPGTGFRAVTSLTVVRSPEELAVLEAVVARHDAWARGLRLLEPSEARQVNPALCGGESFLAALHCRADAVVEPRQVLGALRAGCEASGRYRWLPGHEVVGVGEHRVTDASGGHHGGDLVVLCPGAAHGGLAGEVVRRAPLRRVRLQMLETAPFATTVTTALADGDSLRYYPGFDVPARAALPPQDPVAASWSAQLLVVQRAGGALTLGDTHSSAEPFPFDVDEQPYRHLCGVATGLLGEGLPPIVRRWAGVYSQVVDPSGTVPYFRADLDPGVEVVTGPGGRGMTMAPAIARETFG